MALAELQLSQPGAGITLPNDATGNLSSVENSGGLAHPITITATMSGGVLPAECDFVLRLREVPLNNADDSDAFSSLTNPTRNTWVLTLDAGCWGALVVELTVTRNGQSETTTRRYNFRSPIRGLPTPGNAEIIDSRAARSAYGGAINRRSWYSETTNAPPSGYSSFYRELVRGIEASGIPPVSALNFFARRGSGAAGSISAQNAYQEILGVGREYTLSHFGWTSGDIAGAFQAAVNAACAAGGGTVLLPAGYLVCSAEIVVPPITTSVVEVGLKIRGAGYTSTLVNFSSSSSGITFQGNASEGGGHLFGGAISDLMLLGTGSGTGKCGLTIRECVFFHATNIWIRNFADAQLLITQGTGPFGCQDISLDNVCCQGGGTGLRCVQVNQGTWTNVMCNQNLSVGMEIARCIGLTIVGGLMQEPASCQTIWFRASGGTLSIDVSFVGPLYFECATDGTKPLVKAETPTSFSSVTWIGIAAVQGSQAIQAFMDFTGNYSVACLGRILGNGWAKHIKATNIGGFTGVGLEATPSKYDFDATSAAKASWLCEGSLHVGSAAPLAGSSTFAHPVKPGTWTTATRPSLPGIGYNTTLGRMEFSIDGTTWRKLAEEA